MLTKFGYLAVVLVFRNALLKFKISSEKQTKNSITKFVVSPSEHLKNRVLDFSYEKSFVLCNTI